MLKVNQDKLCAKTKKMAEKISKMTAQEYEIFMSREIQKIKQIEDRIIENNKKIEKIKEEPTKKELDEIQMTLVCAGSTMTCMLAGGALGMILGEPEVGSGDIGVVSGLVSGLVAMFANVHAYEKRPLSNYLNKVKIKTLENKNKKLYLEKEQKRELISCDCDACR